MGLFQTYRTGKVFDKIKDLRAACVDESSLVEWKFLGHPVCLRGWQALHSLGCLVKTV